MPAAFLLMMMISGARGDAWEAIAHFRWDGSHGLSILMEDEKPPCGAEAGFAPEARDIVNKYIDPREAQNSSVIFFIGGEHASPLSRGTALPP